MTALVNDIYQPYRHGWLAAQDSTTEISCAWLAWRSREMEDQLAEAGHREAELQQQVDKLGTKLTAAGDELTAQVEAVSAMTAAMADADMKLTAARAREEHGARDLTDLKEQLEEALIAGAEARNAVAALVLKEVKATRAAAGEVCAAQQSHASLCKVGGLTV